MSLKAIEMQVALPRTYDAGKLQDQQDQRGQVMNNHALQATLQEEIKKEQLSLKEKKKGISPVIDTKMERAAPILKERENRIEMRSCYFLNTLIKEMLLTIVDRLR